MYESFAVPVDGWSEKAYKKGVTFRNKPVEIYWITLYIHIRLIEICNRNHLKPNF